MSQRRDFALRNDRLSLAAWILFVVVGIGQLNLGWDMHYLSIARGDPHGPPTAVTFGSGVLMLLFGLSQLVLNWQHLTFTPAKPDLRLPSQQLHLVGLICLATGITLWVWAVPLPLATLALGGGIAFIIGSVLLKRSGN